MIVNDDAISLNLYGVIQSVSIQKALSREALREFIKIELYLCLILEAIAKEEKTIY